MNAETSQVEKSNRVSDSGDTRGCVATLKKKKTFINTKERRVQNLKLGGKKVMLINYLFSKCRKANFM